MSVVWKHRTRLEEVHPYMSFVRGMASARQEQTNMPNVMNKIFFWMNIFGVPTAWASSNRWSDLNELFAYYMMRHYWWRASNNSSRQFKQTNKKRKTSEETHSSHSENLWETTNTKQNWNCSFTHSNAQRRISTNILLCERALHMAFLHRIAAIRKSSEAISKIKGTNIDTYKLLWKFITNIMASRYMR